MKYIALLFLCLVLFGCHQKEEYLLRHELVKFKVTVLSVRRAKHSRVIGSIKPNGLTVYVDNGNTGYHYKRYSLKTGDVFDTYIDVYYYATDCGYSVEYGNINVSQFEVK